MIKPLLLIVTVVSFSSCKKDTESTTLYDRDTLPVLYKTTDSTLSTGNEDRVFYYYNSTGLCDSIVSERQFPGYSPLSWSYMRMRYEYTQDGKPLKLIRKDKPDPTEYLYSEVNYDNNGIMRSYINYGEVHSLTYDNQNRVIIDTQYNTFGVWYQAYTYIYDKRGNVIEHRQKHRISNAESVTYLSYDNAINPLFKNWNSIGPNPVNMSPNNVTSVSGSHTISYQYNQFNLPVKAQITRTGIAEPIIRTFYYQ